MRRIILGVAVSLDGLIEGPNGEYDWCFTDQDYGLNSFMERIDAIFYGRKSYEVAGGNIYPDKRAYIFSNTMKRSPKDAVVVGGDILTEIQSIKQQKGKDIWLFGGASLTTTLMNADLVDELWLAIHPIVLGAGKPLFQNIQQRKHYTVTETKTYDTGLVSVWYSRKEK